ncbi:hypothetical protein BJV74DRAFT_795643 [Russula compacta]|nr:hypothetical protein BJV74DRAFT_795643 [Russula compacta]
MSKYQPPYWFSLLLLCLPLLLDPPLSQSLPNSLSLSCVAWVVWLSLREKSILSIVLEANVQRREKAAEGAYSFPPQTLARELPSHQLTKWEHHHMFPMEFKAWYGLDQKCAHKGYPGLPAWLMDNLFVLLGPLPHNSENICPADPAGVPTTDTRNKKEGLLSWHAAQVIFTEIWPPAAASSLLYPRLPPSTSSTTVKPASPSTPALSASSDPITVPPPHQPIIIPQEEAIDLTMSDDKDACSYHVHSPSADSSVQEIVAPGEEDSNLGSNWEEYSIQAHRTPVMLTRGQVAKYVRYKIG